MNQRPRICVQFYKILFKILQRNGFGWYYVDVPLYVVAEEFRDFRECPSDRWYQNSESPWTSLRKSIKLYLEPHKVPSTINLLDFDQVFDHVSRTGPHPMVDAYRSAMGQWPHGYPLEKKVYLTVFNGLEWRKN